jgi:hypothetical protein
MSDFVVYPDWWKQGARVIGRDGTMGVVTRGMGQKWAVEFEPTLTGQGVSVRRYMPDPNPADWSREANLVLTELNAIQVAYEADRAFLSAIGRGMRGADWASVPDSKKQAGEVIYATPLAGDGYAAVRKELHDAIDKVLSRYVK